MKKRKVAGPFQDLYRQSACQANQLAADIFSAADTQKSQEMLTLLESGRYLEIVSASINPEDYSSGTGCKPRISNVDTFMLDYQCVEMMSKFPTWDLGVDRAHVALSKFSEVEERLAQLQLNENFRIVAGNKSATMRAVVFTARNKIEKILGELDMNEVYSFFAFGPGASTSQSRRRGDAAYKFGAQRPQLTYNAVPLASALCKVHPTWRFSADVVSGSKLITVPKNAKTDRTICIEPDLNMYFQKGLGKVIRKRLNRWGLLTPKAQEINQELAREGSAYGHLATVDLSSASDSIHMGLVGQLLPASWCDLVELMRSPMTVLPSGDKKLLRKVSSMGNGFTFELETLIFYALCLSVIDHFATNDMDHRCTVFGDDIIIDRALVEPLREVFATLGFEMNPKKTFTSGPFRESCGKHYFSGTDVTPFYIRSPIDSVLRKYWAANTVRRKARQQWGLDRRFQPAYERIVDSIPSFFQGFKIPEGVGDGGLMCDWDEARPSRATNGYDGWRYEDIVPRNKNVPSDEVGQLLKSLHKLEFPRTSLDVEQDVVDQIIGALSAGVDLHASLTPIGKTCWNEGVQELIDHLCLGNGFGAKSKQASLPRPKGFKRHVGASQQWSSFGPWL